MSAGKPKKILIEALAAHEVFRKLGFTPDEIFINPTATGDLLVLIRRDSKQFAASVGTLGQWDATEFKTSWVAAVEWWNSGRNADRQLEFETSDIRKNVVSLIASMAANGFAVKKADA